MYRSIARNNSHVDLAYSHSGFVDPSSLSRKTVFSDLDGQKRLEISTKISAGAYFSRKSLECMAGARIFREKRWNASLGRVFLEKNGQAYLRTPFVLKKNGPAYLRIPFSSRNKAFSRLRKATVGHSLSVDPHFSRQASYSHGLAQPIC